MVTPSKYYYEKNGELRMSVAETYYGLSTDTKPTVVGNGSAFIEMDTGKIYFFNAAEGGGWIEWGA